MGSEHSANTNDNEAPIGLPKLSVYSSTPNSSEWTTTKSSATPYKTPSMTQKSSTLSFTQQARTIQEEKMTDLPLEINNGVTNKHISSRIASIAAQFWSENVESMSFQEQLEISVAIYFGMMVSDKEMKHLLKKNLKNQENIESMSIRFLNMMGWLLRSLMRTDIDLHDLLTKLGQFHRNMGIKHSHFKPMLDSMHETLSYYFATKYSVKVKYSMDNIFRVACNIMMGVSNSTLNEFMVDDECLKSLECCLKSANGRKYLYQFLAQTWCDEMAIYLQSMSKFRNQTSDKGRFMIARDIVSNSIDSESNIPLNISHECRAITMVKMKAYEQKFLRKDEFTFPYDFFEMVDLEVHKLIIDNHWVKFRESIKSINKVRASSVMVSH